MSNPTQPVTITTLEELGLAKNEAILYSALLQTVDATIPYLLKNTTFSRTLLYYLLGNLEGYGLIVSEKKGSKTHYNAEPPEKLADMIQDREKEFRKQKDLLKGVMSDLYSTYRLAHNKPGVKFYEGLEGISVTFDDIASKFRPNTEIISFVKVLPETYEARMNEGVAKFINKRISAGVKTKVLAIDSPQSQILKENDATALRETRILSTKDVPLEFPGGEILVYENEMYIVTVENNSHFAFKIASPALAQLFKAFFFAEWSLLS